MAKVRDTQQTVSVNVCLEDLLSPTIFGLNWARKTGVFFSLNFRDVGNVMPVLGTEKRPASIFGKTALINSGNNISFPRIS